jgi:hypothetical protein
MPEPGTALPVLAASVLAYWCGRLRLGQRLDRWADGKVGGPHGVGWWAAQVVLAVHIAWMVTAHPLRTRAALRTSREPLRRSPAPVFDSQWINRKDRPDA